MLYNNVVLADLHLSLQEGRAIRAQIFKCILTHSMFFKCWILGCGVVTKEGHLLLLITSRAESSINLFIVEQLIMFALYPTAALLCERDGVLHTALVVNGRRVRRSLLLSVRRLSRHQGWLVGTTDVLAVVSEFTRFSVHHDDDDE
jgi:hypothetical protein